MKLVWDKTGERIFETGVDHGVLYVADDNGNYPKGVAWNGLTTVTESPSGAEPNDLYADNMKYLSLFSAEEFGATIECYTYPDEWRECDGSKEIVPGVFAGQQNRKMFGFCYRTLIGNDVKGQDLGYKLHLVYSCKAQPSEKSHETVNDSPDAVTFSYEVTTTPLTIELEGDDAPKLKPLATLEFDSTKVDATKLAALEAILYGTDGTISYTEFTGSEFEAGVTYYERSGSEGAYVYTPTSDTEPQSGKTYYIKNSTGADARLPLPAEVINMMRAA